MAGAPVPAVAPPARERRVVRREVGPGLRDPALARTRLAAMLVSPEADPGPESVAAPAMTMVVVPPEAAAGLPRLAAPAEIPAVVLVPAALAAPLVRAAVAAAPRVVVAPLAMGAVVPAEPPAGPDAEGREGKLAQAVPPEMTA